MSLQALVRTALARNEDVQIAATRVLEAEAQLGITRSDQYPSVDAGGWAVADGRRSRDRPRHARRPP